MRLSTLHTPFAVMLAPMAGVTDMPFRQLCKRMGCDMTFTEMVSAKGLHYGNERTNALLTVAAEERPCAVQLFGREPEILSDTAKRLEELFPGDIAWFDINMGCPAHKITSNGEGSALMRDMPLAARIIAMVAKATSLPVTVKFRKGWDDDSVNAPDFARMAEQNGAAAVAVHGRTRAQGYAGRADWAIIAQIKAMLKIPVLGNGDIFSAQDALNMRAQTGCDGVLVARGAQGNPFLFREIKALLQNECCPPPTVRERIETAIAHARMQQAYKGQHGIIEMRKHLAWYVHGLPGAARLRVQFNECTTLESVETLLLEYMVTKLDIP